MKPNKKSYTTPIEGTVKRPSSPFLTITLTFTALVLACIGIHFGFAQPLQAAEIAQSSSVKKESLLQNSSIQASSVEVLRYKPTNNTTESQWEKTTLDKLEKKQEFQMNGAFCYIDDAGLVRLNPNVKINQIKEATQTFDPENWRYPKEKDVVNFTDDSGKHLCFDQLGMQNRDGMFFFQGCQFKAEHDEKNGYVICRTGIVISEVTKVFKHKTDTLMDLTIADKDGVERVISGTPEHPFYVPAMKEYVPMCSLQPGTALLTDNGSTAIVKSSKIRHEGTDVYNFEVKGTHNYFVSSPSGGPAVNVHNTCTPEHRAYLNAKYGRTGNLDNDINMRSMQEAIQRNAAEAVAWTRVQPGVTNFGTTAHARFAELNMGLRTRYAGTFDIRAEQFRNAAGREIWSGRRVNTGFRPPGTIGADVVISPWGSPTLIGNYDLKTYLYTPRAIGPTRQGEFRARFGLPAQEIYHQR